MCDCSRARRHLSVESARFVDELEIATRNSAGFKRAGVTLVDPFMPE